MNKRQNQQGTPTWQIVLVCVLLLVLMGVSQLGGSKRPASAPTTVYPSSVPAPAPMGPIWIKRGEEVYTRLQNEGRTNRMATVDFKSAGISCSLVLVKGTWQTLTSADQDSLAALLADYAKGRPWRLFDGGNVMRSSGM